MTSWTRVAALIVTLGGAGLASEAAAEPVRAIIVDAHSGVILHAARPDAAHPPASLAKLMGLYLVFDGLARKRFKPDTRWAVSAHAASQPPSKLYLSPGERVGVADLIQAIVVKSANDAAVVVAEGVAGSELRFVWLMNETARRLGMRRTRFANATGLDRRGQTTTARDMAILGRALLHNFREYYPQFARTEMRYRGRLYRTSNAMLRRHWPVDGMKIGFTNRSGFSFVASAHDGARRIVTVVLGAPTAGARFARTGQLIRIGFARARASQARFEMRNGRLATPAAFSAIDLLAPATLASAAR